MPPRLGRSPMTPMEDGSLRGNEPPNLIGMRSEKHERRRLMGKDFSKQLDEVYEKHLKGNLNRRDFLK